MDYQSFSPQLKLSCYNCSYFQIGDDMLNGFCHAFSGQEKSTIGIGTCKYFTAKKESELLTNIFMPREEQDSTRQTPLDLKL